MMHPVRKFVERHAPGSLIPRDAILAEWDRAGDLDPETWKYVPTARAAEIMDVPETTARARARRWLAMQEAGRTPPVRVRADMSESGRVVEWHFHEGDCWRVRQETGGGPRPVRAGTDGGTDTGSDDGALDEHERTLRMWGDYAVGQGPPPKPA